MRSTWWTWWSLPVMAAGCMALPLPDDPPVDEGQKNLEAVRELLAGYPCHSCRRTPKRSDLTQEPDAWSTAPGTAWPPGPSAGHYPIDHRPRLFLGFGDRSMPRRSSASGPKVTIPWKPTMPSPMTPEEPFRPVPPYVNGIPAAPDNPSPLRCVPDFSGGQRCR